MSRPSFGPFVAHPPIAAEFQGDDGRSCMTCGKHLGATDPGSPFRNECAECQAPKEQGPAVAFVHWKGMRLGFDSLDRALGFIRINWEANDPRYYCGPAEEPPVLEVAQLIAEAK